MNRRQLLKLLLTGGAGLTLDLDRLLWIPNTKKIFLPTKSGLTTSQIIEAEFNRIIPHIERLFERDDTFYQVLQGGAAINANRDFTIPLEIKPKDIDWGKALILEGFDKNGKKDIS